MNTANSPVKSCWQAANLPPTVNYLLYTSHLDFTVSSLVGKVCWQLLPTTLHCLPTTTKHFDMAVLTAKAWGNTRRQDLQIR